MRKTFFVLITLCLAVPAMGQDFVYFKKKAVTGAGDGSVLKYDYSGVTSTNGFEIGNGGKTEFVGGLWTDNTNFTLTKIQLNVARIGTGGNCEVSVTIRAGADASLLATSTNTINSSTFTTSLSVLDWNFSGYVMSSGSTYYIGMKVPSGTCSTSGNAPYFTYANTGTKFIYSWISSWTEEENSSDFWFKAYGY